MTEAEKKTDIKPKIDNKVHKKGPSNCFTLICGCLGILLLMIVFSSVMSAINKHINKHKEPETAQQETVKQEPVKPKVKPSPTPKPTKKPLEPVKPSDPRIALLNFAGERVDLKAYEYIGGLMGTVITAEEGNKIFIYIITESQLDKEESLDILDAVIRMYPIFVKAYGGDWFNDKEEEEGYYSDLYDPYQVEIAIFQFEDTKKKEIYKKVKPKGEPFKHLPCPRRTLDYGKIEY